MRHTVDLPSRDSSNGRSSPAASTISYEFAFAAASLGWDVELRGWLDQRVFDHLSERTGARPRVDLPARAPEDDDLVIVPEGWRDPLDYLRLLMSPARVAVFVLGRARALRVAVR